MVLPSPAIAALLLAITILPARGQAQAHEHGAPTEQSPAKRSWYAGAHGVLLGSHVSPAFNGESRTEGYLTQPTLFGGVAALDGQLSLDATISLEGLTLERGELGPGTYGEGYVDRRHPHTYLHELIATLSLPVGGVATSLAAGRGFASFGTDDPMMRPFVRYPVNHHLGQILERLVVIGAMRAGPLMLEGSIFNGDEPSSPTDLGSIDRFGDSWAARMTGLPVTGVELQVSHASVESPELPDGGGWDQRKWSASARHDRATRFGNVYALIEWKRTTEMDDGDEVFSFGSTLGEASLARGPWSGALRVERTERPEEERSEPFRTPWPHGDLHVLGITRWTIASARLQHSLELGDLQVAAFVEVSRAHVGDSVRGLFDAEAFYGSRDIWSLSLGASFDIGSAHHRMGRYGVAVPPATAVHH